MHHTGVTRDEKRRRWTTHITDTFHNALIDNKLTEDEFNRILNGESGEIEKLRQEIAELRAEVAALRNALPKAQVVDLNEQRQ